MGSVGKSSVKSYSVTLANGVSVDLPEELEYSTNYNPKMPQSITDFENKRKTAKIEFSTLAMDDGTVVESNRGGHGSVRASIGARRVADVLSHNHPRATDSGVIGGTFSTGDITNFMRYNQHTYRAVAGEGTYSMTKGSMLASDPVLRDTFVNAYNKFDRDYSAKLTDIASNARNTFRNIDHNAYTAYKEGKTSYEEYRAISDKARATYTKTVLRANNQYLIDSHKWFLKNQKIYDYQYGLIKH